MCDIADDELACVYSALILQDGNSPVTADKLRSLLKTASVDVEPFWPGLFAKALESINLKEFVSNIGAVTEGPIATILESSVAPTGEAKKEEKKEEEEEEEDDDMGFGLFD